MATMLLLVFAWLQGCLYGVDGFYIPGVAPVEFEKNAFVPVMAVKLTSVRTQLPYEYYRIKFCTPTTGNIVYKTENLGEVLRGDRIVSTPYQFRMNVNETCKVLCDQSFDAADVNLAVSSIEADYRVHLLVDNLPVASPRETGGAEHVVVYEHGYALGSYDKASKEAVINNHLQFVLKYHEGEGTSYRVVGFEVYAASLKPGILQKSGKNENGEETCQKADSAVGSSFPPQVLQPDKQNQVMFTYGVEWQYSDLRWASRWDVYLSMPNGQIHWFAILNSIVIVFFLSGVLAVIIIRTLRRDIAKYNQEEELEEALEESGWKLVHGDVLRPPHYHMLLSAFVGTGVQLIAMASILIVFAMLGMLSPASRGALLTAAVFIYVFMGIVAGYFSGRLYKTLKGMHWKRAALMTSLLYPSVLLGTSFILNFFIWGRHSSGAVPFGTMVALLCLWLGISLPLVFMGYFFGYRKQPYDHPVRTNQIPRQVPQQTWYLHPIPAALLSGILPFGAMFIELFFIFSALWQNQFYYLFGFLFLVYLILITSCSQISIVMVYFQLCAEDYHWWWRSFIVSGGSAVYLFAYSIFYYFTKLDIEGFIPTMLYFGYSVLMAFTFWLLTGTVGFYAAYVFVKKIYGAIKID